MPKGSNQQERRGKGFVSIETIVLDEIRNIQEKISKMTTKDELLSECLKYL